MVLNLAISLELEARLRQEAERRGVPLDAVTLELLDQHLPPDADGQRRAAVAMLHGWVDEDAALSEEVAAQNAAVLRNFDENRCSFRRLFDDVLRDETCGSAGAT